MQGQYQPRAPGIAAGQSARTTTATYFDYQGVMRVAQPGELRPNFVYQNGVWVQDGYLREGAATNYCAKLRTSTGQYGQFPETYLVTENSVFSPSVSEVPSDTQTNIFSFYIILNHPQTTATVLDLWWDGGGSDGCQIDLQTKKVTGPSSSWGITCEVYGNALRGWLYGGPAHATIWNGLFIPRNGSVVAACAMTELKLVDKQPPSSWIPYGQTRGAD